MCVRRIEAMQQANSHIGNIVAIGILQEQQIRNLTNDHATTPEFKSGWVMQLVREDLALIGFAVVVGIGQNQQLVIHLFDNRLPVRISRPGSDPQATFRIERHLHWTCQFRKLLFRCKQIDLQSFVHRHRLNRFFTRQEQVLSIGTFTWLVGNNRDEGRGTRVVNGVLSTGDDRVDLLVTFGRHEIQHFQFSLNNFTVGLAIGELQIGAATIG